MMDRFSTQVASLQEAEDMTYLAGWSAFTWCPDKCPTCTGKQTIAGKIEGGAVTQTVCPKRRLKA